MYCGLDAPEKIFTSSNTGGTEPSRHMMADLSLYERAFTEAFEHFYGPAEGWSIYGLLPNYLQREGSSLVYMVDASSDVAARADSISTSMRSCSTTWRATRNRRFCWE